MAILNLGWQLHGTESFGANPPIPIYQCELGKDKDGVTWLCRVKYRHQARMFLITFDKDVMNDDGDPFLRTSVIDADDYWQAMRDYYDAQLCPYEKVQDRIRQFIIDHGIDAKDSAGKAVQ